MQVSLHKSPAEVWGSYHLYIHSRQDTALLLTRLPRLFQWSKELPPRSPYMGEVTLSPYDELNALNVHLTADSPLVARSSDGIDIGSACIQFCVHVRDLPCQYDKSGRRLIWYLHTYLASIERFRLADRTVYGRAHTLSHDQKPPA